MKQGKGLIHTLSTLPKRINELKKNTKQKNNQKDSVIPVRKRTHLWVGESSLPLSSCLGQLRGHCLCCSFPAPNSLSWTSNPGPLFSLFHPPGSYRDSVCLLPFKHATLQVYPSFRISLFWSPHFSFPRRHKHSQRSEEQRSSQEFWKQFHCLTSGTMADVPLLNIWFHLQWAFTPMLWINYLLERLLQLGRAVFWSVLVCWFLEILSAFSYWNYHIQRGSNQAILKCTSVYKGYNK